MSAPILLIVFNRPNKTRILVDFLKSLPKQEIFIAADGARNDQERAKCLEVRAIIEELAELHQIYRRYSDRNLGCGLNVSSAIKWILTEREEAIVVEDDVRITKEFLDFCNANLKIHQNNNAISCISGGPLINLHAYDVPNVFGSRYPNIWGWATWRRVFEDYDLALSNYTNLQVFKILSTTFDRKVVVLYWFMIIALVRSGKIDTWDFQFYFMTWARDAVAITPRRNLTENIGFDSDATHTKTAHGNVGKLDGRPIEHQSTHKDTNAPIPYSEVYDTALEREVYKINLFKLCKFVLKYFITKKKAYN